MDLLLLDDVMEARCTAGTEYLRQSFGRDVPGNRHRASAPIEALPSESETEIEARRPRWLAREDQLEM